MELQLWKKNIIFHEVVEKNDKVKSSRTKKVRNKGSVVGQSVLVADQELGKTQLSQNYSSLVDVLANLLNDENTITVLTPPPPPISTTGLIYTHGNCTPCSEIDVKVPEQDVQDKDIDSNCICCTGIITEGSEEIMQELGTSQRFKGYFCTGTVFNLNQKIVTETETNVLKRGLGYVSKPN